MLYRPRPDKSERTSARMAPVVDVAETRPPGALQKELDQKRNAVEYQQQLRKEFAAIADLVSRIDTLGSDDIPRLEEAIRFLKSELDFATWDKDTANATAIPEDDAQAYRALTRSMNKDMRGEQLIAQLESHLATLRTKHGVLASEKNEQRTKEERVDRRTRLKELAFSLKKYRELSPLHKEERKPSFEKEQTPESRVGEMLQEAKHLRQIMEMGLVDFHALNRSLEACEVVLRNGENAENGLWKLFTSEKMASKDTETGNVTYYEMNPRNKIFYTQLKFHPISPGERQIQREGFRSQKDTGALALALHFTDADLTLLEPLLTNALTGDETLTQATSFMAPDLDGRAEWVNALQGEATTPDHKELQTVLAELAEMVRYRTARDPKGPKINLTLLAAHLRIGMDEYSPYVDPEANTIALERFGAVLRARLDAFYELHKKLTDGDEISPRFLNEEQIWLKKNIKSFARTLRKMCEIDNETEGLVLNSGETPSRVRDIVFGRFIYGEEGEKRSEAEVAKRISAFASIQIAYENLIQEEQKG